MKLAIFCLLLTFYGTYSQFQVPLTESEDVVTLLADLEAQVDELKTQLQTQNLQLEDLANQVDATMELKGVVYVRWGRTTCDNEALTETVYSGVAGGTDYTEKGGGSNYQCLPTDPQWGTYRDGPDTNRAYMYGAEYQMTDVPFGSFPVGYTQDVPCAVCYVPTRGSKLMIPAHNTCPTGWIKEYDGYLMAEHYNYAGKKEYVCVDGQPETVPGGHVNLNGALFHLVEARCGSLPCPNYVEGRELTCVVCTK